MTGKTDIIKGRIKEAAGVLTGDEALRAQGQADQAVGNVKESTQKAVNEAKEAAHTAIDKAKHAARKAIDSAKDAAKKL